MATSSERRRFPPTATALSTLSVPTKALPEEEIRLRCSGPAQMHVRSNFFYFSSSERFRFPLCWPGGRFKSPGARFLSLSLPFVERYPPFLRLNGGAPQGLFCH